MKYEQDFLNATSYNQCIQRGLNNVSIQLIQQATTYMEEHICEDINYADVTKSVHMSNYNFHRTFSFIVGMTANEYKSPESFSE